MPPLRHRWTVVLAVCLPLLVAAQRSVPAPPLPEIGTFSILGYDPETGEMGAAVQSRVFSVGNGVISAEAGVGVVTTQAYAEVSYGPQALALLRQGLAPKLILSKILEADVDPGYRGQPWPKAGRQFAVMNAEGEVAAYTGPGAPTWAGDKQGKFCSAQGNILKGPDVVANMVQAFEATEINKATGKRNHLSSRLVAALEAGDAAGGDTRGKQSSALIVVKKGCGVWLHNDVELRLQVDDNPEPIQELHRLVDKALASPGQMPCWPR
jgi:uncharacterized Ntn-hydrolase superfamily protein